MRDAPTPMRPRAARRDARDDPARSNLVTNAWPLPVWLTSNELAAVGNSTEAVDPVTWATLPVLDRNP